MRKKIYSTKEVKAASNPAMKYYVEVEDPAPEFGLPCEEMPGYSCKHIAWMQARPEYEDALMDNGIDMVELVQDGDDTYLAYAAGNRVYRVDEEDIRRAIGE